MAGAKPLNLREWIDLSKLAPPLTRDLILRIEATVEAGRFLPEPPSERELHAWLWTGSEEHGQRAFDEDDLGQAMHKARESGLHVCVRSDPETRWEWIVLRRFHGKESRVGCHSLAAAARTFAAWAYEAWCGIGIPYLIGSKPEAGKAVDSLISALEKRGVENDDGR
jgi:hypothetical protein